MLSGPTLERLAEHIMQALAGERRVFVGVLPLAEARALGADLTGQVRCVITDARGRPCAVWVLAPRRLSHGMQGTYKAEAHRQLLLWLRLRREHEVFIGHDLVNHTAA